MPETYTTSQLAAELGYTRDYITRLIKQGTIKATRIGSGHWRITAAELERLKGGK